MDTARAEAGSGPLITTALVLKRWDYSETSQTGRLYTRDAGRLSVLAKGIKRGGADLRGPMDLFALAEAGIRRRRGSDLHLLVRYRVVTGFPGLRRGLERLWAAFHLAEILHEGTRDDDPDPALFDAFAGAFRSLEEAAAAEVPLVAAWAELRWLDRAGFRPRFDACALCGRAAPPSGPARFSPARSGLVCRSCQALRPHRLVPLRASLRLLIRALEAAPDAASARPLAAAAGAADRRALRSLLPDLVQSALEKELRSASWVAP